MKISIANKTSLLLTVLVVGSFTLSSQTVSSDWKDGEIYCKLSDTTSAQLDSLNLSYLNLITTYLITLTDRPLASLDSRFDRVHRIQFSNQVNIDQLVADLNALSWIEWAEKVPLYPTSANPDDFNPADQWYLQKVDAPGSWDLQTGDQNVVIAVVDNATRITHPDLSPNLWTNTDEANGLPGIDDDLNGITDDVNGADVADNDGNPNPPDTITPSSSWFHGSHVSGICAAATNNGQGIASLSHNVSLMAIKATASDADGGAITDAYLGIKYAVEKSADIINMSFGTPFDSRVMKDLMEVAHSQGIVLVGAAGNNNTDTFFYPAAYPDVIAVGATNELDQRASFSNYGDYINVMAPGVNIRSAGGSTAHEYVNSQGTSMAAPVVASLAGLILSADPGLDPDSVLAIIERGCDEIDDLNVGEDSSDLGAGRINGKKSLQITYNINTSLNEVDKLPELEVYPIPASRSVMLRMDKTATVMITDLQGRILESATVDASSPWQSKPEYAAGTYILHVHSEEGIQLRRIQFK